MSTLSWTHKHKKREVGDTSKEMIQERQNNFNKITPAQQRQSSKAISKSIRDYDSTHIIGKTDDMTDEEATGNTMQITRLVSLLGGKVSQHSLMPSIHLKGDPIVTSEKFLEE